MKITKDWLEKYEACEEGKNWFLNQSETNGIKVINALIADDKLDWANWTICRIFNRKQKIQYAVYAAGQVLHIYEEKYPDDKRPRKAIAAAKFCIENNTAENRAAARDAGDAAWAATGAARAAAWAAWAAGDVTRAAWAATGAARAAAWAAWAAGDVARAAWAAWAAGDVAKKELQLKILNYGISLLK